MKNFFTIALLLVALTRTVAVMAVAPSSKSVNEASDTALTQQLRDQYLARCKTIRGVCTQDEWNNKTDITVPSREAFPLIYDMVKELTEKMDMDMPTIQIYKGTLDTKKTAYFTGIVWRANAWAEHLFDTDKDRITIGADLLVDPVCQLQYSELKAVVAHELAHVKHGHVCKRVNWFFGFWAATAATLAGIRKCTHYATSYDAVIRLQLAADITPWVIGVFPLLKVTRLQEEEADRTAATVVDDPTALTRGLEKLYKMNRRHTNVFNSFGNAFMNFWSTHPTLKDREKYLEEIAAEKSRVAHVA